MYGITKRSNKYKHMLCFLLSVQAGSHNAAAGLGACGGSLMDSPVMLFGCADGVVRGISLRHFKVRQ